MSTRDIVVIGASTGGIEALKTIVESLTPELSAAIFVVLHTAPSSPNVLDRILACAGPLSASNARDGEQFRSGHIYVAPADHHLLLEASGGLRLTRGPKENRFRPAIDPLFRSAAQAFGPRVIGVILTGFLDDGTAGLWAVKVRGGMAIVQDPEDAVAPAMPRNALQHVPVDYCVTLKELGPLLVQLAGTPVEHKEEEQVPEQMETEVNIAKAENALESGIMRWGELSPFACPECHGVLLQLKEGSNLRFRCHTGHAYSLESLLTEIGEQSEAMLWNAVRCLEERMLLLRRIAAELQKHGHPAQFESVEAKAKEAQRQAEFIRRAIVHQIPPAPKENEPLPPNSVSSSA